MKKELINKLVEAMEIHEGKIVLFNLWGNEDNIQDLYDFVSASLPYGVVPMTMIHSQKHYGCMFNNLTADIPDKWYDQFDNVDVVVDIMNYLPGMTAKLVDKEKKPLLGAHLGRLFNIFARKEKLIQITMPTAENAAIAGMDYEVFKDRTLKALDIDYNELKESCNARISSFTGNTRTIRSGSNCVLTIDTTGREWFSDAGDGALPCGEIYIAPVEEKSNGQVYFEKLDVNGLGSFDKVTINIEKGRIVSSTSKEFDAFIKSLPDGGDIVAELGIGMNPNVQQILGDSGIDEDAIGTFHIAIGMNNLFGGKNECPVHIDFVTVGTVE